MSRCQFLLGAQVENTGVVAWTMGLNEAGCNSVNARPAIIVANQQFRGIRTRPESREC